MKLYHKAQVGILFCCVLVLLSGCISGGVVENEERTFRNITVTIGGVPSVIKRYELEIITADEKDRIIDIYDTFPSIRSDQEFPIDLPVDTKASTLSLYLYRNIGDQYPIYFWEIDLNKSVSKYSSYYWLSYWDAMEGNYYFGLSNTMAIPLTEYSYTLDFDHAPYYLFEITSNPEKLYNISVTALEGTFSLSSIPSMWGEYEDMTSVKLDNLQKDCYLAIQPSSYGSPTKVELRVGEIQITDFTDYISLLPSDSPDLVFGIDPYNLYLINPLTGQADWVTLPVFKLASSRYSVFGNDLYAYYFENGNLSYFVWDNIGKQFLTYSLSVLGLRAPVTFNPFQRRIYAASTDNITGLNYVNVLDMDSEELLHKFLVTGEITNILVHEYTDDIICVYDEDNPSVICYVFEEDQFVPNSFLNYNSLLPQGFSQDGKVIYFWESPLKLVARDSYNLTRALNTWDIDYTWYMNKEETIIYNLKSNHIVELTDMQTHSIKDLFYIRRTFFCSMAANSDDSFVLVFDGDTKRLIYYPVPKNASALVVPLNRKSFLQIQSVSPHGYK